MCVVASPSFGNRAYWLSPAIVSMTEFGETSLFEPIIVLDNSPNVQIGTSAAATCGYLIQQNAILTALPCNRAGSNDDAAFFFFLKRKFSEAAVVIQFQADAPRHITCRQMTGVLDTNMAQNAIALAHKMDAEWLNGEISTLQNFCFLRLISESSRCGDPQTDCRNCKHSGEKDQSERIARYPPIYQVLLAFFIGCCVAGVVGAYCLRD